MDWIKKWWKDIVDFFEIILEALIVLK